MWRSAPGMTGRIFTPERHGASGSFDSADWRDVPMNSRQETRNRRIREMNTIQVRIYRQKAVFFGGSATSTPGRRLF